MSLLEDRLLRIVELRRSGLDEIAIAEELDISQEDVLGYEARVKRLTGKRDGVRRLYAYAGLSEMGSETVAGYYGDNSKKLEKRGRKPKMSEQEFLGLVNEDLTRKEIAERCGVCCSTVINYEERLGVKTRRGKKETDSEKKNARVVDIRQGLSLEELRKRWRITRQGVNYFIVKSGLHNEWKKRRDDEKKRQMLENAEESERKEVIGNVVWGMQQHIYNKSTREEQRAFDYLQRKPARTYFEKLVKLFGAYKKAEEKGEKLSVYELGKKAGLHFSSAHKIIKRSGLEPMYRTLNTKRTSKSKKQALRRIAKEGTKLSFRDVGYFLGVPFRVAGGNLKRYGIERVGDGLKGNMGYVQFGEPRRGRLTYRLASQVYEAIDFGYDVTDTAEVCGVDKRIVRFCQVRRNEISKDIGKTLSIIFQRRKSRKPYLTSEERKLVFEKDNAPGK